jgi:hypothetical protein
MRVKGRAKGCDHQSWPNSCVVKLGLFSLAEARDNDIISLRKAVNN